MVIIDRLIGKSGDVRGLTANFDTKKVVDLSDDAWGQRLEVLQDLHFDRVRLARTEVKVNFVGCTFESSHFQDLRSDGHFWAASNRWRDCLFVSVNLEDVISPMNTFRACRFKDTTLTNYRIYQTLFEDCSFEHCKITGLRAQLATNRSTSNPDLRDAPAAVLFRRCTFQVSTFEACYFEGIGFEGCSFDRVEARASDFAGIVADRQWWSDQSSDPFTQFLAELLELIRKQCGRESAAYSTMQDYVFDYKAGRTRSQDFSACLYAGQVPDDELDQIEAVLPKLMAKFPF